ncbi:hypothetical protein [Chitinophaga sp. Cy-1792]|uniref:hypothetical protein n=1 Tax=Chitinophaga sp. Cy-1792 TaxID=2608339 RepID=UPI0014248CD3|nr:hypothetical protein [Chitinophaga sp. Cy-1792]NIG56480.1 hypothetical protein [Chitinophaga sp. Cy-1792]
MLLLYLLYGIVIPVIHQHPSPDFSRNAGKVQLESSYIHLVSDHPEHTAIHAHCYICDDYNVTFLPEYPPVYLPKPTLITVLPVHPSSSPNASHILAASNKGPPAA